MSLASDKVTSCIAFWCKAVRGVSSRQSGPEVGGYIFPQENLTIAGISEGCTYFNHAYAANASSGQGSTAAVERHVCCMNITRSNCSDASSEGFLSCLWYRFLQCPLW